MFVELKNYFKYLLAFVHLIFVNNRMTSDVLEHNIISITIIQFNIKEKWKTVFYFFLNPVQNVK